MLWNVPLNGSVLIAVTTRGASGAANADADPDVYFFNALAGATAPVYQTTLPRFWNAGPAGLYGKSITVTGNLPSEGQYVVIVKSVVGGVTDTWKIDMYVGRPAVDPFAIEWAVSGATLTVKQSDDTTTAYTKTVATDNAAQPIVSVS